MCFRIFHVFLSVFLSLPILSLILLIPCLTILSRLSCPFSYLHRSHNFHNSHSVSTICLSITLTYLFHIPASLTVSNGGWVRNHFQGVAQWPPLCFRVHKLLGISVKSCSSNRQSAFNNSLQLNPTPQFQSTHVHTSLQDNISYTAKRTRIASVV